MLDVRAIVLLAARLSSKPRVEDLLELRLRSGAQAERERVGVIPAPGARGGGGIGAQGRAHARDLVGGDRGARARPAADDGLLRAALGHVARRDTDYFIRKYVFPGGWIPSLADTLVEMERAGLEILDVENLRRHYAITLDHWAERFDRNWERIKALDPRRFNERFRRIWRVYLYGCAEMFRSPASDTHLFQIVFSKGNVSRASYPMTRDFLYQEKHTENASAGQLFQEKRSSSRAA